MKKQTYKPTKPKVFYDLMNLFEKINSANKNIARYDRTTIIEPYILNNIVNAMKDVSRKFDGEVSISKTLKNALENIEIAREFFMFYSQNKKLNYISNIIAISLSNIFLSTNSLEMISFISSTIRLKFFIITPS